LTDEGKEEGKGEWIIGDEPKAMGVIFMTTKTNIQFQAEVIACIFVPIRVVLISEG
jgi:hypothetical protein